MLQVTLTKEDTQAARHMNQALSDLDKMSSDDLRYTRSHLLEEWNYFEGRNQRLADGLIRLVHVIDAIIESGRQEDVSA